MMFLARVAPAALLSVLVGSGLIAFASPAMAEDSVEAILTDPRGDTDSQLRLESELIGYMQASTPGSTIRLVDPTMNARIQGALVEAWQRGVNVRVVLDAAVSRKTPGTASATSLLEKALGTDAQAPSFVATCVHGCYQPNFKYSLMHAKTTQFSDTGGRKVTVIGSQDLFPSVPTFEWNAGVSTSDPAIYAAVAGWIDGMTAGSTRGFSGKVASGGQELYLFPRPADTATNNFFTQTLKPVSCASGTRVDLMTYDWRANMSAVVHQLGTLRRQGCPVRVITYQPRTAPEIVTALRREGISARYSDNNRLLSHSKVIAISGTYGGARVDTVFQGSANIGLGSIQRSDDDMIRINNNAAIYRAFYAQVNEVWSAGRALGTMAPTLAVGRTSRRVTADLRAGGGAVEGAVVQLQRRIHGSWVTVSRRTTSVTARAVWQTRSRATVRVRFGGNAGLTSVTSRSVARPR